MKSVFICSPFSGPDTQRNIRRAQIGCRLAALNGFIPMAPHLFFTQFLNEEKERNLGIQLGLRWLETCDELWVLGDRISEGMAQEIAYATELGIPIKIIEQPEKHLAERK